jgi:hypothetical protein
MHLLHLQPKSDIILIIHENLPVGNRKNSALRRMRLGKWTQKQENRERGTYDEHKFGSGGV